MFTDTEWTICHRCGGDIRNDEQPLLWCPECGTLDPQTANQDTDATVVSGPVSKPLKRKPKHENVRTVRR